MSKMSTSILYVFQVFLLAATIATVNGQKDADDGGVKFLAGYSDVSPYEGIVQVYRNGKWGAICANSFNISAATVLCRDMGLAMATRAESAAVAYPDHNNRDVVIDNLYCAGTESSFDGCSINWSDDLDSSSSCTNSDVAAIACSPITDYSLRLMGGASWYEGRVEVYERNYKWGTICNDYWSNIDAKVVCRQLKYGNPDYAREKDGDLYKAGSAGMLVLLDNVHCTGSEKTIATCGSNGWHVENCVRNTELAAVFCEPAGQTGKLTTGGIVGIVIGSILAVMLLVALPCMCYSQSRSKKRRSRAPAPVDTSSGGGVTYISSGGPGGVTFINPSGAVQQQPVQYIIPGAAPAYIPPTDPPPAYMPPKAAADGGAGGGASAQDP